MKGLKNFWKRNDDFRLAVWLFIGLNIIDVIFRDSISWELNALIALIPPMLGIVGYYVAYGAVKGSISGATDVALGVLERIIEKQKSEADDAMDEYIDTILEDIEEIINTAKARAKAEGDKKTPDASDDFDEVNGDDDTTKTDTTNTNNKKE